MFDGPGRFSARPVATHEVARFSDLGVLTPDFAIGFWQSWRYEVQIVNSEIRQWRPAR